MHMIALFPGYRSKCKGGFQVPLETEVEGRQNIHCSRREISGSLSLTFIPLPCLPQGASLCQAGPWRMVIDSAPAWTSHNQGVKYISRQAFKGLKEGLF